MGQHPTSAPAVPEVAASGEVISTGQEASEDFGEYCMPR